jgi:SAM-dependent methyltransferase
MPIDLSTAAGRSAFEQAIAIAQSVTEADPVRRTAKVRALLEPDLATAALAQAELRARARAKFGDQAQRLYFTSDGLEQATRAEIADHRAARFAAAGVGSVLDLCCGIGADVAAFVRAGLVVTAVERDPATAAFAQANCPTAAIEIGAAEDAEWGTADAVFLDPARRTTRGRTFDPASYSPSLDFVLSVLAGSRYAAAKLGPGIDHALIPQDSEAEWVSFDGRVKEAVLWSAGFATARRRATVLPAGVELTDHDALADDVGPVGRYLYEPDGAVIRAGLVQQAAALLPGGRRLDEHLAYLSADVAVTSPFARGYAVHEVLPYSVKRLRAELARREVGIVEIKKRGVDIDPSALRRELKPRGVNSLTVILARVGDQRLAVLATPLR